MQEECVLNTAMYKKDDDDDGMVEAVCVLVG